MTWVPVQVVTARRLLRLSSRAVMMTPSIMPSQLSWPQVRELEEYRGRWVALDHCKFDGRSKHPIEGVVVDVDDDLVALCTRLKKEDRHNCAILFCEEEVPASSVRAIRAVRSA
jgi:hypothetical protein